MPRSIETNYGRLAETPTFFQLHADRKAHVLKEVRTEGAVNHELGEPAGKGYYTHQVEHLSRSQLKEQRRAPMLSNG